MKLTPWSRPSLTHGQSQPPRWRARACLLVSACALAPAFASCADPGGDDEALESPSDSPSPSESPSETASAPAPASASSPATEGTLQLLVTDHEDGSSEQQYQLQVSDDELIALHFADEPDLQPGERIRVRGEMMPGAGELPLLSVREAEPIEPHDQVDTVQLELLNGAPRSVNVAFVLVKFPGVATSIALSELQARAATMKAYYQEISYGTWNVNTTVLGPVEIAKPSSCGSGSWNAIRQAIQGQGVSLASYQHVGLVMPRTDASGLDCGCGVAYVGGAPATPNPNIGSTSVYGNCPDTNALAHECGHAFGLGHASTLSCGAQPFARDPYTTSACTVSEYGNRFNTMGNGLGHMNAFQKATMKWLDKCNVAFVTRDATFDVEAIQKASNGLQGLRIPTGDTHGGNPLYYYVEYRNPALAKFNTSLETAAGVHVDVVKDFRSGSGGSLNPLLLDFTSPMNHNDPRLSVGSSYQDPSGRVTVKVLESNQDKARIEVTFPGGGSGTNVCIDGSAAPTTSNPPASVAEVFQHCDPSGWRTPLAVGAYNSQQLAALGAANNAISSLTVSAGFRAVLFDGDNFTGDAITVTANDSCLVDDNFNDRTSSIRIEAVPAPAPTAKIFQHCWYGGYQATLTVGDYTLAQLQALGVSNNDLSSAQVPAGYELVLYDSDNFAGASVTRAGSDWSCFVDQSWNDRVSSLRYRKTP